MGISIGNGFFSGKTGLNSFSGISSGSGLSFSGFGTAFSPASLFAAGEQGVWYDPSDLTTLFQDSAGTTAVTAVEQPVGLMLDKSKNLALGSELVTNGTFNSNVSGWTVTNSGSGAGTFIWNNGKGRQTVIWVSGSSINQVNQGISVTAGKWYKITGDLTIVSGVLASSVSIRDTTDPTTSVVLGGAVRAGSASSGSFSLYYLASSTTTVYLAFRNGNDGSITDIDNVSVVEIAGNHAFQSTSGNRPTLSARVNLLTKTEQFNDAVWAKSELITSGTPPWVNVATAPDNTTTADFLIPNTTNNNIHYVRFGSIAVPNATMTLSFCVKAAGYNYVGILLSNNAAFNKYYEAVFNLSNGTIEGTGRSVNYTGANSITNLGDGWYRCSITINSVDANSTSIVQAAVLSTNSPTATFAGNGTSGIYIWGADLRVANQSNSLIPQYQRVNTSTDYDTTGFPLYLLFNGTSSNMATSSIDFSATDKMTVWAGVRKLSDSATGTVAELTASWVLNAGAFALLTSSNSSGTLGAFYRYASRGNGLSDSTVQSFASNYAAPITNVITGISSISNDNTVIRVNGIASSAGTGDQGTGNYSNAPLYIGSRNNASLWLNGQLYPLIIRGAASTNAQITNTESYINSKTKAYA